jgi:hypothetical protein
MVPFCALELANRQSKSDTARRRRSNRIQNGTQLGSENRILPDAHFFQHLAKIGRMPEIGYERLQHCVLFDLNEVWRSNSSRLSTELSLKKESSKFMEETCDQLLLVEKLVNSLHRPAYGVASERVAGQARVWAEHGRPSVEHPPREIDEAAPFRH